MKISQRGSRLLCLFGLWLGLGLQAHAQTNTVTYVYTDPQGTPLAEADANGTITATFDYAPYGSIALGTAPNGPGYTGHVNDPDTGLVYMQARYYDPSVGRFLSVDPATPEPGNYSNFNRYVYGNNNPILNIDPNGRQYAEPVPPEGAAAPEAAEAAGAAAEAGAGVRIIWVDPANSATEPPTVQQNKAQGDAYESQQAADLGAKGLKVTRQITIKTDSGTKTRVDIVTTDQNGNITCVECKSSSTAPLTKNQKVAFPQIELKGGTVVGKGKPGVPGGTRIPAQPVQIKRPPPTPKDPPPPPRNNGN